MARKKSWNTWEILPEDGQCIILKDESGKISEGVYCDPLDGDGVIDFGEHEPASKIYDLVGFTWKPNETKPIEPKPNQSKKFSLNISTEDLHRYISDGIKADSGATICDMWTNSDDGFIVYGSGLGRVK